MTIVLPVSVLVMLTFTLWPSNDARAHTHTDTHTDTDTHARTHARGNYIPLLSRMGCSRFAHRYLFVLILVNV